METLEKFEKIGKNFLRKIWKNIFPKIVPGSTFMNFIRGNTIFNKKKSWVQPDLQFYSKF